MPTSKGGYNAIRRPCRGLELIKLHKERRAFQAQGQHAHVFPVVTGENHHKLSSLKQHTFLYSSVG